eukprot:87488_1
MASFWISLTAFIFFVFGHHYCNTTTCTGWSTQVTYLGERSEGVVWNGSRYTFRNVIAADETERWKCHARHCNACIYLKDKEFYKYKPHEYDDADARSYEYNLHSDDEPHESWNQSALVSHDAGEFMQELVKLGVHPTKSYQQYILQNPDEVIHFKNKSVFEHKLSAARSQSHVYPPKPSNISAIDSIMKANKESGWTGNYFEHEAKTLKSDIQNLDDGPFKTFITNTTDRGQLRSMFLRKYEAMNQLQKEMNLVRKKITTEASAKLRSEFYIGSRNGGRLVAFGERGAFEIAESCAMLLFDGTFKCTPVVTGENGLDYDMQWVVHGVKESVKASVQHESFVLFYILFAAGQGNHTHDRYQSALDMIISYGINHHQVNLSTTRHRAMADFEAPERSAVVLKYNIIGEMIVTQNVSVSMTQNVCLQTMQLFISETSNAHQIIIRILYHRHQCFCRNIVVSDPFSPST